MLSSRLFRPCSAIGLVCAAMGCLSAGSAIAQPANRPQAFTSAIAAAQVAAGASTFLEAKLDQDDGTWVIEVEFANAGATQITEVTVNASTFVTSRTQVSQTTSQKQAQLQPILALVPGATVNISQALVIAGQRTPDGTGLSRIELEVESSRLVYDARFARLATSGGGGSGGGGGGSEQRIRIDAQSGAPSTGGGVTPPAGGAISLQQAAANVASVRSGIILEVELDADGQQYEVKLLEGVTQLEPLGSLRKIEVAAAGGAIVSERVEVRSSEDKAEDALVRQALLRLSATPNTLIPGIITTALVSAPGAAPSKLEYEFEKSTLLAKVVVIDSGGLRVIRVNPATLQPFVPPVTVPSVIPTEVTISPAQAGDTAAASVPGSFVLEVESEIEAGRSFFKVQLIQPGPPRRLVRVIVDARTGRIWGSTQLPMGTSFLARVNALANRRLVNPGLTTAQAVSACQGAIPNGTIECLELAPSGSSRLGYNAKVKVGERMFELRVNDDGTVGPR